MLKSTCNVIRPTLIVKDQGSKLRFGQAVDIERTSPKFILTSPSF